MYTDCYQTDEDELLGAETFDALAGGLRNKIKLELSKKKRRTQGEYRHTVAARTYWHLDFMGNPELLYQGVPLVRLLWDGARLDFPPYLPQQTVMNRIWNCALKDMGWTFRYIQVEGSPRREFFVYLVPVLGMYHYKYSWTGEGGEDKARLLEPNMKIPYLYGKK